MKTFTVNKNSWHYKLNFEMCKTNERLKLNDYAEKYVQSKDNLCSYWRMTLWSMFKLLAVLFFVGVVISAALYLIYMFGYAILFHTSETVVMTATGIGVFTFISGIISLAVWADKRKRDKLNKILYDGETETSLAKAQYSSWKNGVCVPVEFKE